MTPRAGVNGRMRRTRATRSFLKMKIVVKIEEFELGLKINLLIGIRFNSELGLD
jgi:hypothetical protein